MPGSRSRAIEKARTIPADGLIFDLEDAVAPAAKPEARTQVVEALNAGGFGDRELAVRCNGIDTPWGRGDLAAVAPCRPDAIVVPKIKRPSDLEEVVELVDAASGPGADPVPIWPMIETPTAVAEAREIAALPRVEVLVVGSNDLSAELGVHVGPGRATLLPYLAWILLAARESGVGVLDGVYNDVTDPEGFLVEARQGRAMGFDGKTLLHPDQVEPANRTWTFTDEEVAHARSVIEAFESAEARGEGVVTLEGRMIEILDVERARRVIAFAEAASGGGRASGP